MRHLYPIITTPALADCKDFYVRALGAQLLFESDWYVHLAIDGWELGFLHPNPPTRLPVFQHATLSRGLCLALEVPDVQRAYDEFIARGFEPLGRLERYQGGELAFSLMDPAGLVLNVVERRPDLPRVDLP